MALATRAASDYGRRVVRAIKAAGGSLSTDDAIAATKLTRSGAAREALDIAVRGGVLKVEGDRYALAGGDPATLVMAPRAESDFERMVRTESLLNGLCPFRGGNWCKLDERCPAAVPVVMVGILDSSRRAILAPVPILRNESYCRSCVDENVREEEGGKTAVASVASRAGKSK